MLKEPGNVLEVIKKLYPMWSLEIDMNLYQRKFKSNSIL